MILLSVFKALYPYFTILALVVILLRIRFKFWTKGETFLLCCVLFHTAGEILQIILGDGKWDLPRRYLQPVTPLLFVWTAYGVYMVWEHVLRKFRFLRTAALTVSGALVLLLLYDGMVPSLRKMYRHGKGDRIRIAEKAAPVIKEHYKGPEKDRLIRNKLVYRSPYLPVVYCKESPVAFFAGGRGEPSEFGEKPDYWVLSAREAAPENAREIARFTAGASAYVIYEALKRGD